MVLHAINKETFEFTCSSEAIAKKVQREFELYIVPRINVIIAEVLSGYSSGEVRTIIDTIEIDLGSINLHDIESDEILERFEESLVEKIKSIHAVNNLERPGSYPDPSSETELEMISRFMLRGDLPWWVDKNQSIDPDVMLSRLVRHDRNTVKSFLEEHIDNPPVLFRLAAQYKPSTRKLIDELIPGVIPAFVRRSLFRQAGENSSSLSLSPLQLATLIRLLRKHQQSSGHSRIQVLLDKLVETQETRWHEDPAFVSVFNRKEMLILRRLIAEGKNARVDLTRRAGRLLKKLSVFQSEFLLSFLTVSSRGANRPSLLNRPGSPEPGSFHEHLSIDVITDPDALTLDSTGIDNGTVLSGKVSKEEGSGQTRQLSPGESNQATVESTQQGLQPSMSNEGPSLMEGQVRPHAKGNSYPEVPPANTTEKGTDAAASGGEGTVPVVKSQNDGKLPGLAGIEGRQGPDFTPVFSESDSNQEFTQDANRAAGDTPGEGAMDVKLLSGQATHQQRVDEAYRHDGNPEKTLVTERGQTVLKRVPEVTGKTAKPHGAGADVLIATFDVTGKTVQPSADKDNAAAPVKKQDAQPLFPMGNAGDIATSSDAVQAQVDSVEAYDSVSQDRGTRNEQYSNPAEPNGLAAVLPGTQQPDGKINRQISFIMKRLNTGNATMFNYLKQLRRDELDGLHAIFKREFKKDLGYKRIIRNLLQHPYLLQYDLLNLYASLSFNDPSAFAPLLPGVKEKGRSKKGVVAAAVARKIQFAQTEFLRLADALPVNETLIIRDILKKKRFDSKSERSVMRRLLNKLPQQSIRVLDFLAGLSEEEIRPLFAAVHGTPAATGDDAVRFMGAPPAEPAKIYIENAGLCLVALYLPGLFSNLSYLENRVFKNKYYAMRALYVVQYLATGNPKSAEFLLQFNKLLSGFDLEDPVMGGVRLTRKEMAEADSMIESVIVNWKVLKNTSVDGFRTSFLQRKGILSEKAASWTLQVERKGHDVLLNNIPWGFAMIKLPWMKKMIQVEW